MLFSLAINNKTILQEIAMITLEGPSVAGGSIAGRNATKNTSGNGANTLAKFVNGKLINALFILTLRKDRQF